VKAYPPVTPNIAGYLRDKQRGATITLLHKPFEQHQIKQSIHHDSHRSREYLAGIFELQVMLIQLE